MDAVLRNFAALLLALTVICSGISTPAMAASPAMADMHGMAMMPCGQHGSMPAHKAPCDRQCCSCVMGYAAFTGGLLAVASLALPMFRLSWPVTLRPDGRTQEPALPPPIA